jgi:hypothetical protein
MLVLAMEFSRSPTNGGEAASFVGTASGRREASTWQFSGERPAPKGRHRREGNVDHRADIPRESRVRRAKGPPYCVLPQNGTEVTRLRRRAFRRYETYERKVQLGSQLASASTGSSLSTVGEDGNSLERR